MLVNTFATENPGKVLLTKLIHSAVYEKHILNDGAKLGTFVHKMIFLKYTIYLEVAQIFIDFGTVSKKVKNCKKNVDFVYFLL